ncbi:SprT-like domain-containing protein [Eubacteriales bacterium OttesenSCG-928-A19]|nr:SprT-like domain-containing protein [Eubacteriales bacterium OttesenSCG-928-A19]
MKQAISTAAAFLETAFDVLNKQYFDSALSKPMITIQSTPSAYGHFTPYDAWQDENGNGRKEINLGAENLNRPAENTIATLVHEMVHYYCDMHDIKDTSRNGVYHNKRFKVEAEKRGLVISYDNSIGWSKTKPAPELMELVKAQGWDTLGFARRGGGAASATRTRKPSSTRKYSCPCCGQSVRATKRINIICGDCDEAMVSEGGED